MLVQIAETALTHERIEGPRRDPHVIGFAIAADRRVDRLNEVRRANVTDGVRWAFRAPAGDTQAEEIGYRGRQRCTRAGPRRRAQNRIAAWKHHHRDR